MRNWLRVSGIEPAWVHYVVCAEDDEILPLATEFADLLGLPQDAVIVVPRDALDRSAGREVNRESLTSAIPNGEGRRPIERANVVILDQAAHHFRTLGALHRVCRSLDATVFACLVFVDRKDRALESYEFLGHARYMSLYGWPFPPVLGPTCVCAGD